MNGPVHTSSRSIDGHPRRPSLRVGLLCLAFAGGLHPGILRADGELELPFPEANVALQPPADRSEKTIPSASTLRIAFFVDQWDRVDRSQIHSMLDSWAPAFTSPQTRQCEFEVFDSPEKLESEIRLSRFDAVCVYAYQMPTLGKNLRLDPGLLIGTENNPQLNLVLLVRRKSGIKSVGDLEGKNVFVDTANLGSLPVLWLENAARLEQRNKELSDGFHPHLELCTNSFNALTPVFFGNADACIITQQGYMENAGLNPQILQQLEQIGKSPAFATRVLAFPLGVDRSKKSAILALRPTLKADPRPSGFLSAPDLVFYDVADGDFAPFKDFDPSKLPAHPAEILTRDPSLTSSDGGAPLPINPD